MAKRFRSASENAQGSRSASSAGHGKCLCTHARERWRGRVNRLNMCASGSRDHQRPQALHMCIDMYVGVCVCVCVCVHMLMRMYA